MDFTVGILSVSPIIVVILCTLVFRLRGHISCLAGLICALVVCTTTFKTSTEIIGDSIQHGIIYGLPIILFIITGLLLAVFLKSSGALESFSRRWWVIPGGKSASQVILLNIAISSMLLSIGINPIFVLPPLMILLGYSAYAAIAMPLVGASVLWLYAGWANGIDLFALHLGGAQTLGQAGYFPVTYLGPVIFISCLCVCYLAGGVSWFRKGIIPGIVTGISFHLCAMLASRLELTSATGWIAGTGAAVILLLMNCLPLFRKREREAHDLKSAVPEVAITYLFPLVLTTLIFLATRFIDPVRELTHETLSMSVSILPGQMIKLRPFAMPWFWMMLGTFGSMCALKDSSFKMGDLFRGWIRTAWRPVVGIATSAATIGVMWHSGAEILHLEQGGLALVLPNENMNMISVMLNGSADLFGRIYAFPAVITGLRMGFLSGNPLMSIVLLTRDNLEIASEIIMPGGAGSFIAAGAAVAGSIGLMVNPAWLQAAASSIGEDGIDTRVIRSTILSSISMASVIGIIAIILSLQ